MADFAPPGDSEILGEATRVLRNESEAVASLIPRLNSSFTRAVRLILDSHGKVVLAGVGKSGLIASKISATLSSTGTTAVFLHPTEGMHGDLGIVSRDDVVICISKSGETSELLAIVPVVRRLGASLVAMVGNTESTLARKADVVLDCTVRREACPLDLAPTSSTTAALALGDALAMTLLKCRGFTREDFAQLHPGGSLGRRLLLTVADLMHSGSANPCLPPSAMSVEIVEKLSECKLGGVNIVDADGKLLGLVTDGDVRRAIRQGPEFFNLCAEQLMTVNPTTISPADSAEEAYRKMEYRSSQIMVLPVVDSDGRSVGIIRLHDVVGGGKE